MSNSISTEGKYMFKNLEFRIFFYIYSIELCMIVIIIYTTISKHIENKILHFIILNIIS